MNTKDFFFFSFQEVKARQTDPTYNKTETVWEQSVEMLSLKMEISKLKTEKEEIQTENQQLNSENSRLTDLFKVWNKSSVSRTEMQELKILVLIKLAQALTAKAKPLKLVLNQNWRCVKRNTFTL